jgi:type IV secretory pathway VirB9-like protein
LIRKGFLAIFFMVVALGSDNQADTTTETVVAHDEDIIPLHSSVRETTLIVLPASEKAMGVFCGDKTYWNVDVIPGAERYIAVKPSKAGISTDIHIVTDHNNSYTFQAVESASGGALPGITQR